jgi:hypothetical protein
MWKKLSPPFPDSLTYRALARFANTSKPAVNASSPIIRTLLNSRGAGFLPRYKMEKIRSGKRKRRNAQPKHHTSAIADFVV